MSLLARPATPPSNCRRPHALFRATVLKFHSWCPHWRQSHKQIELQRWCAEVDSIWRNTLSIYLPTPEYIQIAGLRLKHRLFVMDFAGRRTRESLEQINFMSVPFGFCSDPRLSGGVRPCYLFQGLSITRQAGSWRQGWPTFAIPHEPITRRLRQQ
jgi:hypothetical protein